MGLRVEDAPLHPDSGFMARVLFRRALAAPESFPRALEARANSSPLSFQGIFT